MASTDGLAYRKPRGNTPSRLSTQRFMWAVLVFISLYGIWAAILSAHIVDRQQLVRQHFWMALQSRPRVVFASHKAALQAARDLVAALNAKDRHNPCHSGSVYVLASRLGTHRACRIAIGVHNRQITVQPYDTQGLAMDSVYEALHPPPRHIG